ncbi:MAG: hypothetical protein A2Y25_10530 [Candidatus Melainabacteria bacterium GWF2_37_15]|nr:MAG: hypothetical protein A2Y25_10530 [Candidatus Melainabacteria bacterium GWF2_37_15]
MLTELVILAVLLDEECTIYRIKKKLDEHFSLFYSASMGSIHPGLKKLYLNKYVSLKKSTTPGGQRRSTYSITSPGKKYFENLMLNSALSEQIVKIKLLILPKMEKNLQISIIKTIKNYYQDRLLDFENFYENNPTAYIKQSINSISEEISWLNRQELI